MKTIGVSSLLAALLPAMAQAQDIQIWSDKSGLISAPFCEFSTEVQVLNPKMNSYLEGAWMLEDHSVWQVARDEDQNVKTLECLENKNLKRYVVFEVRHADAVELVGVNPDELSVFDRAERMNKVQMASVAKVAPLTVPAGVEVVEGSLDYVVCTSSSTLNVRDKALAKVLFTVPRYSNVKPVQSFGTDKIKKVISGVEYSFIQASFPIKGVEKFGWVAETYVLPRAKCAGAPKSEVVNTPSVPAVTWTFPTIKRTTHNYKEGMRRFKASRSGGRLHAACDLYRVTNETALAITNGTVIRDRYYFYEGTYAIEVKHTGGKVARYGEITGKAAPDIALNKTVKTGQTIGYIGKVNSNCCNPMLHFELYSGTATGALSQSGNAFNRRSDLMDPSQLLTDWEKQKFGVSY